MKGFEQVKHNTWTWPFVSFRTYISIHIGVPTTYIGVFRTQTLVSLGPLDGVHTCLYKPFLLLIALNKRD